MRLRILTYLIIWLILTGCANTRGSNKEAVGTGLGAVVGAALGGIIGGKDHRNTGVVIGGIIGGVTGNRIGHALDERDQRALAARTRQALDHARVGQTVNWHSDHTDATAEITPIKESEENKKVAIRIRGADGMRRTTTRVNVRSGPGSSYEINRTLSKGTEVSLDGVTDGGWYRVKERGVVAGFIYGKYLQILRKEKQVTRRSASTESDEPENVATVQEDASHHNAKSEEVSATIRVKCRTVRVRTKVDGKVTEKKVNTCQGPNGSWGA